MTFTNNILFWHTHLWWLQSVTPAQWGLGSRGIPGAPGNDGCLSTQRACMWRDWHLRDLVGHALHESAPKWKPTAFYHGKSLTTQVRDSRPLTEEALVRDEALVCRWDCHADLCTPRHVRTHAEQVPKLRRRQGRVFVLRGNTGHLSRTSFIEWYMEILPSNIFNNARIVSMASHHLNVTIDSPLGHWD